MARLTTRASLRISSAIAAIIIGTALFLAPPSLTHAALDLSESSIPAVRPVVDSADASLLRLTSELGLAADIAVAPGGSVQSALNTAACGDGVVVQAGVAYPANLTMSKRCAGNPIVIQSSRARELPEDIRVTPAQAPLLARFQSTVNAEPVVKTTAGASGYKFVGIQFETRDVGVFVYDLVRFGEGRGEQKTLESVPHHLTIDRSYIHGWPTQDVQRGVTLNSAHTDITNSYISDIHGVGNDTQAVCGWNGTNTVRLINNYLEAAGENIMFGGADSATAELMPANIEIRRNHLFKPLTWKVGHPTYAGKHWTVKNLLELKAAKNVVIDGNIFENCWTDGQSGIAILFTVRNQDCAAPWSTVQNVTFSNNTVRGSDGGALNFLGKDNEAEPGYEDRPGHAKCSDLGETFGSVRGDGFTGTNNLFYDIGGSFITLNGFNNVSLNRNTDPLRRWNLATVYGQPSQGFKYTNNLTFDHEYGIFIEGGKKVGDPTGLLPDGVIDQNVVVAVYDKSSWPTNNQFVDSLTLPADFRSSYPNAGADIDALLAAQAGTGTTLPSPSPTATATAIPTPTASATPIPAPTATSTPTPDVSADGTRLPPATQIIDFDRGMWTLDNVVMLRNGADTGGRGSLLLWSGGRIYAIGVDSNWWRYVGSGWERVAGDPTVPVLPSPTPTPTQQPSPSPLPSPSPTATSTPSPSPSPTATSTPTPSPRPSPSATVLPVCKPNETVGNPPRCRCLTGMKGNSGKCR